MRNHLLIIIAFAVNSVGAAEVMEVKKESWIASMRTALPAAFCSSEQYFRQCFSVSNAECEDTAFLVVKTCIRESEEKNTSIFETT